MSLTSPSAPPVPRKRRRRWLWVFVLTLLLAGAGRGGFALLIRSWDHSCRAAQKAERWTDLEVAARRWANWSPASGAPWVFLADAVQHQERYVEAAEYLGRVPADRPEYLPAQLARSKLLFGPANRPFDGEQTCLRLLASEPRVGAAHQLLIQFYTVTLQRTKLREQIETAIRVGREPRDAYIYYFLIDSVRLGDGVPLNELWLDSYPDNEILTVAELLHSEDTLRDDSAAPAAASANVVTEKERSARQLLARFPGNANLLAYLCDQELSKGRVDEVVELLAQAPVEAENDQRFWRFKGWVHFVRNEYGLAEDAYRKALAIHPLDWLTMHRLAEILRIRGETAEVARLQQLVTRAHDLRVQIRELRSVSDPPVPLLLEIGRLARDAGDSLIADALTKRLGSLDQPPAARPGARHPPSPADRSPL